MVKIIVPFMAVIYTNVYLGAHKERVELGENAEHLVRALGCAQTVTKTRNDLILYTRDALIVGSLSLNPDLGTLCVKQQIK